MSTSRTGTQLAKDRPPRPRPSERTTRAPVALWDRIRFVVLLGLLWVCGVAVVWTTTVHPLGGPFEDDVRIALHDYAWIVALATLELVRQLHYLIEEHSPAYYRLWEKKIFG